MRFVERFILTIFSIIVLLLSVLLLAIMFGTVQYTIVVTGINFILGDVYAFRTALVLCTIFILFAIKGIFFKSRRQDLAKDGIVLENSSGKLVISKESLENLVSSVSREIPGADVVSSRTVLDKEKNLKVYVVTTVSKDMMLKDVSTELQNKIKEAMKRTADLEVKEVNIKIKNITSKKVKKLKNADYEPEENKIVSVETKEPEEIEESEEIVSEDNKEE